MTPEQKAREKIDKQLVETGWIVQDYKELNLAAGCGIAVCEYPADTGKADYILFINRKPVGVIEAKPVGTTLVKVEEQSERYAQSKLKWKLEREILPFVYESTGVETRFTDNRDPIPRSRELFTFHKPVTFESWIKEESTLRARLKTIPFLDQVSLRDCQIKAIRNLEESFANNKPKALVQMATGSGKTYTAITSVYRLLKFANAKRILFLVDTKNLGEQAEQEFQAYTPSDDKRKFIELYPVQRLNSSFIDPHSKVCISTIQRMYSILSGKELDEAAEEKTLYEVKLNEEKENEVIYNKDVPPEFFDFIIIDECHRSIYNLWKQVLDYFDAFLIGLTATPDKRTFGFFNENVVSEYSHEEAVADGVNVGYDVYTIETEITKNGAKLAAKQFVDFRSKMTRKKRWAQLDEDVTYTSVQLDRDIVNPSTIRQIIRTFKAKILHEIFPARKEVPKTLIFAKTDSHADDIIQIVREEFNEGNDFCKKITYGQKEERPSIILQQFRTQYNPRVAVTVDMIATGTDVKPLECLIFMRDVRSRSYFEQMKGRGTRTLSIDDLRKVTESATTNKDHFVIIDAVGVCNSIKTDSRPLERKPSFSLNDLMMNVIMGNMDEDTVTSLANRLTRIEKQMSKEEKAKFNELADGKSINSVVHELIESYNPDKHIEEAKKQNKTSDPTEKQIDDIKNTLVKSAVKIFDEPKLREYIENVKRNHEQIIDTYNPDKVIFAGFDKQAKENAQKIVESFRAFIEKNKSEVVALKVFYSQPYRRRKLTFAMIDELCKVMQNPPYFLTIDRIWQAYQQLYRDKVSGASVQRILTDIISLLRFELHIHAELKPFADTVNKNFKEWVFKKNAGNVQFTEEQMNWLRMIKDHIIASFQVEADDFNLAPFDGKGGLGKFWQLFNGSAEELLKELNKELAA